MSLRWFAVHSRERRAKGGLLWFSIASFSLLWGASATAQNTSLQHARMSFQVGLGEYERAEFQAAARTWSDASDELSAPGLERPRSRLMLNAATAYERSFDARGERSSLIESREHLLAYQREIERAYSEQQERDREHARARDRLARIERKLALSAISPTSEVDDDGTSYRRKHRWMIAGGALLTVVGVGGLAMTGKGALDSNTFLTASGLAVALTGGVIGVVMMGFGRRRLRAGLVAHKAPSIPFAHDVDRAGIRGASL